VRTDGGAQSCLGGGTVAAPGSAGAKIDVTVRTSGGRDRPGIRIHRCPSVRPDETTIHDGIPVTTTARTLLDLAATLPRRQLERALDQAEILQPSTPTPSTPSCAPMPAAPGPGA
jgi:hypothetical protein